MKKKWLKKAVTLVLTACIALASGEGFKGAESQSAGSRTGNSFQYEACHAE